MGSIMKATYQKVISIQSGYNYREEKSNLVLQLLQTNPPVFKAPDGITEFELMINPRII